MKVDPSLPLSRVGASPDPPLQSCRSTQIHPRRQVGEFPSSPPFLPPKEVEHGFHLIQGKLGIDHLDLGRGILIQIKDFIGKELLNNNAEVANRLELLHRLTRQPLLEERHPLHRHRGPMLRFITSG